MLFLSIKILLTLIVSPIMKLFLIVVSSIMILLWHYNRFIDNDIAHGYNIYFMVSSINDIIYNINYLINDNIVYDIFLILSSIYDIVLILIASLLMTLFMIFI